MDRAACKNMAPKDRSEPDIFFPERNQTQYANQATLVCFSCPVRRECKVYRDQIEPTDGIWGGEY